MSNDGEDEEEEVDDVEVQVESGEDVLLRRDGVLVLTTHHQLSVEDDVLQHIATFARSLHVHCH